MDKKHIAPHLADKLTRGHPLPLHIDAAAELRAQHNALENAESTRRSLLARIAELEANLKRAMSAIPLTEAQQ